LQAHLFSQNSFFLSVSIQGSIFALKLKGILIILENSKKLL